MSVASMDDLVAARSRVDALPPVPQQPQALWLGGLALLLVAVAVVSAGLGGVRIPLREVIATAAPFIGLGPVDPMHEAVLRSIRIPRVLLAAMVGAILGACGAAAQGLFRNPLADPGILGISAGGALAAIAAIHLGIGGIYGIPVAAFTGAALAVLAVQWIARQGSGTPTGSLILAGIAVNAFCGAASGLLLFLSNDAQLRAATNWSLGSVAGASWQILAVVLLPAIICLVALCRCARPLNALALGEGEAGHLGVGVRRLKGWLVIWLALGVGGAVAFTGVIGFVGLAVPHLFRLLVGPDHRWLIPGSALLGALLLLAADTVARTVAAPAELPVGVLTALLGAPFFLWLLRRGAAGGFA